MRRHRLLLNPTAISLSELKTRQDLPVRSSFQIVQLPHCLTLGIFISQGELLRHFQNGFEIEIQDQTVLTHGIETAVFAGVGTSCRTAVEFCPVRSSKD